MKKTIQQRFEEFDQANPEVYRYLCQLAREVQSKGFNRYGLQALWERARWHFEIENWELDYKLNDHYVSRYARKMMTENPDLAGFFEIRRLKAA
jgi:hypothetical protein